VDLLTDEQLDRLRGALAAKYPKARIVAASARTGEGIDDWTRRLLREEMDVWEAPEVDYEVYAEGEALLGWLNAAARVSSEPPFDGNELLRRLADGIQVRLTARGGEVAHLKMTLSPDEGNDLGVINLVRGDGRAESIHRLQEELTGGELLVNLRAEAAPEDLRQAVEATLRDAGVDVTIDHIECFQPAKPTPTYRLATV
jgi:hypothetical protein